MRRGLGLLAFLASCTFATYQERPLVPEKFAPRVGPEALARAARTGSLWRDGLAANYLFADTRARLPGDLITVIVQEKDVAASKADTKADADSSISASLEDFFGLTKDVAAKNKNLKADSLIKGSTKRAFEGEGETNREGRMVARVTATVLRVDAAGNLYIAGDKIVTINDEEQHITVSGVVRPDDINPENEVLSTRLAQSRIDFYGRGVVSDKQRPGWAMRLVDWLWPF